MSYLLITYAEEHRATLYNADTLHVLREVELPGRAAVLGASSDGHYGFAIHRDIDCITIIEPDGEINCVIAGVEKQPTHFHAHGGYSLIFNDGSGSVMIFDEKNISQYITHKVKQYAIYQSG